MTLMKHSMFYTLRSDMILYGIVYRHLIFLLNTCIIQLRNFDIHNTLKLMEYAIYEALQLIVIHVFLSQ